MKKFICNFSVSLTGYLIINFIGYLMRNTYYPEMGINNFFITKYIPSGMGGLLFVFFLAIHIAIISILYFKLGRELNIFDNPFINYLSVCSSFIFSIVILYYNLRYIGRDNQQLIFDVNASYGILWTIVRRALKEYYIGYYIMAIIPSIIIWLGMSVGQRKRIEK